MTQTKFTSAPHNYLSRNQQRRIFWTFMPSALLILLVAGWLERTYLWTTDDPSTPQIDTQLKQPADDPSVPDWVFVEADEPSLPITGEDLGAGANLLEKVRDDTTFRDGDREAWFAIWMTLRSTDPRLYRNFSEKPVGFVELFGQPRAFRGKLVKLKGIVKRIQRVEAPANDFNIAGYWQAWILPEGGPPSPIVVYFQELPPGFPTGMKLEEPVEVVGYFFKRWAYMASDTIRIAPLIMSREPFWKPVAIDSNPTATVGSVALLTMVMLVTITSLAMWIANRSTQRTYLPSPIDLTASLAGEEFFSTSDALRKLSASVGEQSAKETLP